MSFDSEFAENEKLRNCAIKDADHIGEQFAPKGPWVVLIKKALNAWSAKQAPPLPALPLNDVFDSATGDRVALYKTQHSPPILNYANQIDRIVGKKTVAALDKELPARPSPDMKLIMDADKRRLDALAEAERQLLRLKNLFEPNVADDDDPVVKALQRQLFVNQDSNFWPTVNNFLILIRKNKSASAPYKIDKTDPSFAHVDPTNDPTLGITFCGSFYASSTNDNCRQEVITHEYFHFSVGLQHFYSTHANSEAMRCPHHLARAVFDIAVGQQLAPCSASDSICR
jgi:hypothetical protein